MKRPNRPLTPAERNDTLDGLLYDYVRPEDVPNMRRLGFWRMIEERYHRATLEAQGVQPDDRTYYLRLCALIEAAHKHDQPYRDRHGLACFGAVRQQAAFERDELVRDATDEAVQALREIRDGHNDPRALAAAVLAKLDGL